jgi:hypothetical protein
MGSSQAHDSTKLHTTISPAQLVRRHTKVKSGFFSLSTEASFRLKEPSTWLYVPDNMIEWRPGHELLPACTAYDKKSIETMFKKIKIVAGSNRAKRAALCYPFNVSDAGEVSEARPFTTEQQCAWLKQYKTNCVEAKMRAEVPKVTTPDTKGLFPSHSPQQSQNISAIDKAQVLQPSSYVAPGTQQSTGVSATHGTAKKSEPTKLGGMSTERKRQLIRDMHRSTTTTAGALRNTIPTQQSTESVRSSKAIPSIQGTSAQTAPRIRPFKAFLFPPSPL